MRKYANDKEVTTFVLAFMRLMGDHMEELGAEEDSKHRAEQEKRKAEQNKPKQADPAQVQRWMSDPTIRVRTLSHGSMRLAKVVALVERRLSLICCCWYVCMCRLC